jgi:hypothetical protein
MKRKLLQNVYVVFVAGILLGILVAVVGGKLSFLPPNTSAQAVPCGTYPGTLSTTSGGGQFPIQSGENTIGNGIAAAPYEIFEKTDYYYSWTDQGVGEAIVFNGRILGCGLIPGGITAVRYAMFISTNAGASWDVFKQSDLGGPDGNELTYSPAQSGTYTCAPTVNQQYCVDQGAQNMKTGILRIHGQTYFDASNVERAIIDGSWLRVNVQVQANQWFDMATDTAILHSAIPSVGWQQALYSVNDTAVLNYKVPVLTIGTSTAYFLTVVNLNTYTAIAPYSNVPITQLSGQVSFKVTPNLYVPFNVNRIRAEISSQIFVAAMQDTATIDNPNLAPPVPTVTWDKPFYREGDLVTISIVASPNPITQAKVTKYYVLAHVGGIKYFDGFSATSTVSFTAANAGPLTAEVSSYDAQGRNSGVSRFTVSVGPAVGLCVQYPQLPQCGPGSNFSIPAYWIALMIAALASGLVLLLIGLYLPANPLVKIPLVIVGALLSLAGVAMFVIVIANWVASLIPGVPPIIKW